MLLPVPLSEFFMSVGASFFMTVSSTSVRINEKTLVFAFLHANREVCVLVGELPGESDQFRFIRSVCLDNLKGSLGLMLSKDTVNTDTTYYSHSCLNVSSYTFSRITPSIFCRNKGKLFLTMMHKETDKA